MTELQRHRGPDGVGTHIEPGCSLGHVRLSILDLSEHARQPMSTDNGRYWLIFNGEIYNFRELRQGLVSRGAQFCSTGDSEVLLHGLAIHGESFISRLNGMFAFAFWDSRTQKLLLARDQLGIKPLYYVNPEPGVLIFASEIKALFASNRIARRPNFEVLQHHLAFCHSCSDETAFEGVRRLPPGSLLRWSKSRPHVEISQYWNANRQPNDLPAKENAAASLRSRIFESVARQLVSDVPLGAFLSGGLDSSLIACAAVQAGRENLDCYTITYAHQENHIDQIHSDAPYARKLSKQLGCRLTEVEVSADVVQLWPKLVYHLDEPIADPAAITCYLISKLARENGTKVLLSGQGADELFGGYPRYQAVEIVRWFRRVPFPLRWLISGAFAQLSGSRSGKAGAFLRRLRRLGSQLAADPTEQFLNYCMSSPVGTIQSIWSKDVRSQLENMHPHAACRQTIQQCGRESLEAFLYRDMNAYLPNHNLLYTDKMGMAVGLEARVPFLDNAVVDHALSLSAHEKVTSRQTKIALREAARGIVPEAIINRPKAGFGAPFRKWLKFDLQDMWNDLLSRTAVQRRGWFDFDAIERIRTASLSGQADYYLLQWAILTIELWAREFIDANIPDRETFDLQIDAGVV